MKSIFNKLLENIIILNWWFEHNFKRKHQLQFGVTLLTLLLIVKFYKKLMPKLPTSFARLRVIFHIT